MKKRKKTMLEKSISMNLDISANYASKGIGWLFFAALVLGLLSFPAMLAVIVYAFLMIRELFDRSLFGEEAYTYMAVPISIKHNIIGKIIVACFLITLGNILLYVALGISAMVFHDYYMDWSVGAWMLQMDSGIFDAAEDGTIGKYEIVYDRTGLMHLAGGVVLQPFVALAEGICICGVFQLGYIVRHILDPGRDKPSITVMVVVGGFGLLCLMAAIFAGLGIWLFSLDTTCIWVPLLEIIIFGGGGMTLLAIGVKLLEKKYSLC